jgi:glucosyl-3-phosphoglycerate synthase
VSDVVPTPRRATADAFPVDAFAERSASVTLVVPALDEADNIARTVDAAVQARDAGVLDEVIVVDGGSTDTTAAEARTAGARVVRAGEVYPESGPVLGKGDTMLRALGVVDTDVVAFMDADLQGDLGAVVRGLVGPLVAHSADSPGGNGSSGPMGPGGIVDDGRMPLAFVKGSFHRIAPDGAEPTDPFDGGRVTEMVARPLLNLWRPDLAGFYQPLSGQVAGRTALLRSLPILTGYAVEIGMLLDVVDRVGLGAVVEVDLGTLRNRPRSSIALAPMAQEVLYGFARRVFPSGGRPRWRPYFRPGDVDADLPVANIVERPPIDPFSALGDAVSLPSALGRSAGQPTTAYAKASFSVRQPADGETRFR